MKYTAKKSVSEVVIDFEDGCVIKLTKLKLSNLTLNIIEDSTNFCGYCEVNIDMNNGINCRFRTKDENLVESLNLLCAY